jgi:tripartite-type tricarboxylate transporter receptor subunit TctC
MRFRTLSVSMLLIAFQALAGAQSNDTFPSRTLRIVVPYPPGGASDIISRLMAEKMAPGMGQSIVVENRPGAGGNIGADVVAKAAPDGYTLLMGNIGPNAMSPGLYKSLPFDPVKDFTTISMVSSVPIVLVVNPNVVPVHNVQELIAYATKATPTLAYASAGNGSSNHLAMELFKSLAKIDLQHVPYKGGGPAMIDLLGGQVGVAFDTLPVVLPHVRSGKLRALAIAGTARTPLLPDVPTVAESGVAGYAASSWGGIMAPAGVPPRIVARLQQEVVKVLRMTDVKERLASQGIEVVESTPLEFSNFVKAEISKWSGVIKTANVKIE